jgi:hypothetical protein
MGLSDTFLNDMLSDQAADWEVELMELTGAPKRKKKPQAKPAFDPWEPIEVKDSRHLFTPVPDKPKTNKDWERLRSEIAAQSKPGARKVVHHRHRREHFGEEVSEIDCYRDEVFFYWSENWREVTCRSCKLHKGSDA